MDKKNNEIFFTGNKKIFTTHLRNKAIFVKN